MKIETMALGLYQTNCYIVWDEESKDCVVIDPGDTPERVLTRLQERGLQPQAILLTHAHFDHTGGVPTVKELTGCKVYVCEDDLKMPRQVTGPLPYTDTCKEGDVLTFGKLAFTVLQTPGHTPGSICLRIGEHLFAGDTLFAGSIGRTDLPLGSYSTMLYSLERLAGMQEDLMVYPGHGEATTLQREKRYNPFMRQVLRR